MAVHTPDRTRKLHISADAVRWPHRVVAVQPATETLMRDEAGLAASGIEFTSFPDGASALLCMGAEDPAAVVVPTELRGVDFDYFVQTVTTLSDIPLIVGLTSHPSSHERAYKALDQGARALLPLPTRPEEVSSVLHHLGSRLVAFSSKQKWGPIALDPRAHRVDISGVEVRLASTEFATLHILMSRGPGVVSWDELSTALSGERPMVQGNVKRVISRLRHKLAVAAPDEPFFIETVRSHGYRLRDQSAPGQPGQK